MLEKFENGQSLCTIDETGTKTTADVGHGMSRNQWTQKVVYDQAVLDVGAEEVHLGNSLKGDVIGWAHTQCNSNLDVLIAVRDIEFSRAARLKAQKVFPEAQKIRMFLSRKTMLLSPESMIERDNDHPWGLTHKSAPQGFISPLWLLANETKDFDMIGILMGCVPLRCRRPSSMYHVTCPRSCNHPWLNSVGCRMKRLSMVTLHWSQSKRARCPEMSFDFSWDYLTQHELSKVSQSRPSG